MVPWKVANNIDALGDDSNPNANVLSNTTPRVTDAIKSWKQVFDILENEIINCPDETAEENDESFSSKLKFVAQLELHNIVARPRIISYNDMISWDLEHVDIQTNNIINHQQVTVGSFWPENLQVMYKISPTPKYTYNVTFLLEFERKECTQYAKSGHDIVNT